MGRSGQHWVAFLTLLVIGVPAITLGAWAGVQLLATVSGHNWTRAPLPGTVLPWIGVAVAVVGAVVATFPAIYLWLKLLKGYVEPAVVYHWLNLGPQPPILSTLARRMFVAVFGPPPTAPPN